MQEPHEISLTIRISGGGKQEITEKTITYVPKAGTLKIPAGQLREMAQTALIVAGGEVGS